MEARTGGRAATEGDVLEKQGHDAEPVRGRPVGNADVADRSAGAHHVDGLLHGRRTAHALEHVARTAAGHRKQLLDGLGAVAAHDVGRSEGAGLFEAIGVVADGDDALSPEATGGQHRAQPHGAVTDHQRRRTGLHARANGRMVSGAAVGDRRPKTSVAARSVHSRMEKLAGAVGDGKGREHEVSGLDMADGRADLLDDAHRLVPGAASRPVRLLTPVKPQVRAAHGSTRDSNDGVGRCLDLGIGSLSNADVFGTVKNGCSHGAAKLVLKEAGFTRFFQD